MEIDMSRFLETFFEESAEHLGKMESALLELDQGSTDPELLNGIFRGAHSIKGASGIFSFNDVTHFTHALENLLDLMREGKIAVSRALVTLLLEATDTLGHLIDAAKTGAAAPEGVEALTARIVAAAGGSATPTSKPSAAVATTAEPAATTLYDVVFAPGKNIFLEGMDPQLVLRELAEKGEIQEIAVDLAALPSLADVDPEHCVLAWKAVLASKESPDSIREVFAFVADSSRIDISERRPRLERGEKPPVTGAPLEAAPMAGPPAAPPPAAAQRGEPAGKADAPEAKHAAVAGAPPKQEPSSIRVSVDKVDKLINLAGELVIAQSMIAQVIKDFSTEKLEKLREAVTEMDRNTRDLQEQVMAVRMVPIGTIWARFPRLVRDLAGGLGKSIRLETVGEDTELDKTVIERIGDPLTHLLRNSADHGIETAAERRELGKPEEGVITLSARHQGGSVIIEVADDGKGLDLDRIKRKGIEKGLVPSGAELSPEQIQNLIFAPGFSTAEAVTDVSGRGVGMDVVKRNVEALNGSISIESRRGQGTRFRIKLPLTLAVLDGLALAVGSQVYLMPLLAIVESLKPKANDVKTIFSKGEVLTLRGEPIALLRLHRLFGIEAAVEDPTMGVVVIIESDGSRFGLLVDSLLGQSQVVIKNLESNFRRIDGLMGATILGDGRIALILDSQGLVRLAQRGAFEREPAAV